MDVCEDGSWASFNDLGLCTSHCGRPPIRHFGYEAPSADGFSVGYFISDSGVQFCITTVDKDAAQAFKASLQAQLDELKELFTSSD